MTDDFTATPGLGATQADPVKTAATNAAPSAGFSAGTGTSAEETAGETLDAAKSAAGDAAGKIKAEAGKLRDQAADKARAFATDGKEKATSALDEFARMIDDAANAVDDRIGPQYGSYARSAADTVAGIASQLRGKDVDELFEDARGFVKQSPAVAIGAAAAIGFVFARLVKAGLGEEPAKPTTTDAPLADTPISQAPAVTYPDLPPTI